MNPILEKISQATKMITKFTKAFEITEAQAMEDGVIDDDEQQDLDELKAQIDELEAVVKEHKKTLSDNIAEWKGLATSYSTFKGQLSELQEKEEPNAPRFAETVVEIDRLVKEYFWKDASTNLQAVIAEFEPIYNAVSTQEETLSEAELDGTRDKVSQIDSEIGNIEAEMDALEEALTTEMETAV